MYLFHYTCKYYSFINDLRNPAKRNAWAPISYAACKRGTLTTYLEKWAEFRVVEKEGRKKKSKNL